MIWRLREATSAITVELIRAMEKSDEAEDPRRGENSGETEDENIERTLEDSFPASDPPSYAGGRNRERQRDSE